MARPVSAAYRLDMEINPGQNGWEHEIVASRRPKRGIVVPRLSRLTLTIAWVALGLLVPVVRAQEPKLPAVVASVSAPSIPTEFLLRKVPERIVPTATRVTEAANWRIAAPERAPTEDEAWARFEVEYRPEYQSPSLIKHQIESAKYGLDCAVFAFSQFSKNLNDSARFKFDHGCLRRASNISAPTRGSSNAPRAGILDNVYVKLDLEMPPSKPYVGVRVVFPLGN